MLFKRKNKNKKEFSNLQFAFSLGSFFIFALVFWFLGNVFLLSGKSQENEVIFSLQEGYGLSQVASNLEDAGLIQSKTAFILLGLCLDKQAKLLAGDYGLSPKMSSYHILKRITTKGQARTIVIFEGFTLKNITSLLQENEIAKQDDFLYQTSKVDPLLLTNFPFLAALPEEASLEGFLLPDSYQFSKLDNSKRVIEKMLLNFQKKVLENKEINLEEKASQKDLTLFEIVIMASLLEKEVRTYYDKQVVAGILWKRLKNNWPLQVDATLVYLTEATPLNSHKEIDSPYNTYKYRGLPPGPICNPGVLSIKAALNPVESPYWYYLSARDGTTIFSKTLHEHNLNRAKYLR